MCKNIKNINDRYKDWLNKFYKINAKYAIKNTIKLLLNDNIMKKEYKKKPLNCIKIKKNVYLKKYKYQKIRI